MLQEIKSTSQSSVAEPLLPKLARSELKLGNILGQGGFSLVYEITKIEIDEVNNLSDKLAKARIDLANEANRSYDNNDEIDNYVSSRYAVKMLRDDLVEEDYAKGIIDLAVEAKLLQRMSHPNIVSMKATANSDPLESRFFIILEVLNSTLDDRITYWRQEITKTLSIWCGPFGYCCANKPVLHKLWLERIEVSRCIASALKYLHNDNIIYRDLKPENIGFDENGQVKVFDFGLAKKLYERNKEQNGLYQLTGNTGSLRYMAPEVALNQNYNLKADSYSFAMVFWQICSLQVPFAGYNVKMHADLVLSKGYRPKVERSWPFTWGRLMSTCWSSNINERFDFDEIFTILDAELDTLYRNGGSGVGDKRHGSIKAKKKEKEVEGVNLDIDTRKTFTDGDLSLVVEGETSMSRRQVNANIV